MLVVLVSFYQFWRRDLTYFDEPRYAGIAREMSEAHSYAIPMLYGKNYTEKPPLWFWLAMLAGRACGFTTFAYFLPNVVSHFLSALLVFDLGRRTLALKAGALAALGFAACPLSLHYARSAQLDPLMALGITLCGYGATRALVERRLALGMLAALGFAIASLVKGHLALIGLIAPLAWCFVHREWGWLRRPWRAALLAVLAVAPIGVWFSFIVRELGWNETVALYFQRQVISRSAGGNHYSPWPVGPEYLGAIAAMLPLVLFLPRALTRNGATLALRGHGLAATAMFVAFAIIPSKREIYLLPFVPLAALVVGGYLADVLDGARQLVRAERTAIFFVTSVLGFGAICISAVAADAVRSKGVGYWVDASLLVVGGVYGMSKTIRAMRSQYSSRAPVWLLLQTAIVLLFAEPTLARVANARFGMPAFGEIASTAVPAEEPVYVLEFEKAHAAQYFLRRRFEFTPELKNLLDRVEVGKPAFVLTREKGAKQLKRIPGLVVQKVASDGKTFEKATLLYRVLRKP